MSNYAGKLQFRDDEADENIGEEVVRKPGRVAEKTAKTVRNINKDMQKRKIQRGYIKAVREAQKRGETVKNTAVQAKNFTQKIMTAVKKHPVALLIIGGILLIIIFFMSAFISLSTVITGALSGFSSEYGGVLANPLDFDWTSHISSDFGWRTSPITGKQEFHRGVDIPADYGTEIHAAHSGTVTFAGWGDSYGYHVIVDDGIGTATKYAHCSSILVEAGQTVAVGQPIALVGSTGDSTAPHLHLEVSKNGELVNPLLFFINTNQ